MAQIDGDELLQADFGLQAALRGTPREVDALIIRSYEAVHDSKSLSGGPFAATHFRTPPSRLTKALYKYLLKRRAEITHDGFFGHTSGKYLIRPSANVSDLQIHRPILAPVNSPDYTAGADRSQFNEEIRLLHFDCMTLDDWVQKWAQRIDKSTIAVELSPKRRLQQQIIAETFASAQQSDRQALYESWFSLSALPLFALSVLGVIVHVPSRPAGQLN